MIERVGDFRNTDFAVQFLMNNIIDFFRLFVHDCGWISAA